MQDAKDSAPQPPKLSSSQAPSTHHWRKFDNDKAEDHPSWAQQSEGQNLQSTFYTTMRANHAHRASVASSAQPSSKRYYQGSSKRSTNLARELFSSSPSDGLNTVTTPKQSKRKEEARLQRILESEQSDGRALRISLLFDKNRKERLADFRQQKENINNLSLQKSEESAKRPKLFSTLPVTREANPWMNSTEDSIDRKYVSLRSNNRKFLHDVA